MRSVAVAVVALSFFASDAGFAELLDLSPKLVRVNLTNKHHVLGEPIASEDGFFGIWDVRSGRRRQIAGSEIERIQSVSVNSVMNACGKAVYSKWNEARMVSLIAEQITKHRESRSNVGRIARIDGATVYVTLGETSGIEVGDALLVFREDDELRDPATGELLGNLRTPIAELKVSEVRERFCKTESQGDLEVRLHIGDSVQPIKKNDAVAILDLVDAERQTTELGRQFSERLVTRLVQLDVDVVERNLLDKTHVELAIQQSDLFDASTAQKVGRMIGAESVLVGTVGDRLANIRLVRVADGTITFATEYPLPTVSVTATVEPSFSAVAKPSSAPNSFETKQDLYNFILNSTWRVTAPGEEPYTIKFLRTGKYEIDGKLDTHRLHKWSVLNQRTFRFGTLGHRATVKGGEFQGKYSLRTRSGKRGKAFKGELISVK